MQCQHLVAEVSPAEVIAGVRVGGPLGKLARWLPAFATVLATIILLLLSGTALTDIAKFGLYVVWAIMLPGVLVYRSLRRVAHSLVDDLAMGTAVGCVLELAAWAVFVAAGLQAYLWAWPALVVGVFLLSPRLRRHWRPPDGYRRASVGWAWAVAGIALAVVGNLVAVTFGDAAIPLTEPTWYYLDTVYLLSLVTDSMHHFPPGSPQVAGEPLNYHWFSYAHVASSSLISGVEAPIVFLRLTLPLICVASVVLMAVVGWRIGRRPWVGVLAAVLMFATMEFGPTTYALLGLINGWIITISPSVGYAWLSTIPLVLMGVELLRQHGVRDAPLGSGAWALLALFAVAAAGAKATNLVVLLAGFGLAGVAELVRRRFPWRPAMLGSIVAVVFLAASLLLYKSGDGGMRLEPLQLLRIYLPGSPMSPQKEAAVLGVIGGAYAIYLLARLSGIPVLAWLAWRRRGPEWSITEWFLLGPVLAGVVGTQMLASTTWAQVYLIRSAWP